MYLSLQDFRTAPATYIVSLGARCALAYNLRRFYNFRGALPFDWWITSNPGVAGFLRRMDIEYLYDPTQLELSTDAMTVRHRGLNFHLHHEFPRENGNVGAILPNWLDTIELPKSRTAALVNKFLALNSPNNRIVFVREQVEATDHIAGCLEPLFFQTEYTFILLPQVPGNLSDKFGWLGDPQLWDKALGALGLSFDSTNHRPFDRGAGAILADHAAIIV
ncbi:MAG TPA: DUF1796 family putative cysteine peptidase [Rhizomicrobium sp.]